ncbi:class I SAM-dependent methyltransferase [Rhodobacteraceae bacterium W635]|uniref:SAM-dependent methyltransferase n=1 Tax=Nioella halotolerans TaxID=2303578 RepID=UPI000E3CAEE5|nr:class I SAM-dependent methyltransferase [Rhodobacteraceae bacterium W635]
MWEDRYKASGDYLFGQQPAGFLLDNPGWLQPGQRALCVADGEGRNSVHLAERGLAVTAFDMAPTAVDRGRALAAERGVSAEFHVSDWAGWDWTREFDLVVAIFIQFADPDARKAQFGDLRRTVAPGGVLMLHGYTPEQVDYGTGGPPDRSHMYTPEMLADAFGGWRIERLAAYEREVQEGRGHSGRSALIDLIARRPKG